MIDRFPCLSPQQCFYHAISTITTSLLLSCRLVYATFTPFLKFYETLFVCNSLTTITLLLNTHGVNLQPPSNVH